MKVKVITKYDEKAQKPVIEIRVEQQDGLTFAQAKAKLEAFASTLNTEGLEIVFSGVTEQHSHAGDQRAIARTVTQ
jgi:multidrug efflux pump subunit AcrB